MHAHHKCFDRDTEYPDRLPITPNLKAASSTPHHIKPQEVGIKINININVNHK